MRAVKTYSNADTVAHAAAEHLVVLAEAAVAERGRFLVALAGGSTPRQMYMRLTAPELTTRVDWAHVHVFWGDERCVPPDDPASNYRMAREALLDHVPIPAGNVHRMRGEMEPGEAAAEYERSLRAFLTPALEETSAVDHAPVSRFDLILLGMGEDRHTASLFPGSPALREQKRWVVACYVDRLQSWRVTLTPVLTNAASHVVFILTGEQKAHALRQVLCGPHQPDLLPAQAVRPRAGNLLWMVDAAAAALL